MKCRFGHNGYLRIILSNKGKPKPFSVAHLVYDHFGSGKRDGQRLQIDHINGIKTDNRIENLQLLTNRQNVVKGIKQSGVKKTSKYTGVYYDNHSKKWCSRITLYNKRIHLGRFTNEYDAHLSYQTALGKVELIEEFDRLNKIKK